MALRSLLFTPATRLDRRTRGFDAGADWVIFDLEDGVGPADKAQARADLGQLAAKGFDGRKSQSAVRINAASTAAGILDLAAMIDWGTWPSMIVLPKVESASQVNQLADLIQSQKQDCNILITLETAIGVERAFDILARARRCIAVGFGSADYCAETGGEWSATGLVYARHRVVNAAATSRIEAVDGVWPDHNDETGLREDAGIARALGFTGKIAIHPRQVSPINDVFTPSEEEVAVASAMLSAYQEAGGGAFSFRGKMVDAPVLNRARRIARLAED